MLFFKSQSQAGENISSLLKKKSLRPGLDDTVWVSGSITFYYTSGKFIN